MQKFPLGHAVQLGYTDKERKGVVRESYGLNLYSLLRKHFNHRSQLKRLIGQDLYCGM